MNAVQAFQILVAFVVALPVAGVIAGVIRRRAACSSRMAQRWAYYCEGEPC
jgi:hypothetical protein